MWEVDYKESRGSKNWCFWTVVSEKTLENLLDWKEIQPIHPKGNQSWIFIGRTDAEAEIPNTLATWCDELTHWRRPWCWERLKVGREGDDKGWDGWMASLTRWTWVWVSSGSWQWTGKPGVLWSMGSQRVGHDWPTELNWNEDYIFLKFRFLQTNAALECIFTLKNSLRKYSLSQFHLQRKWILIYMLQEFLLCN